MGKESKAIVLAADAGYLMPLSATLKSIFANGYHGTVYVINNDIPQEWFEIVNAKLQYGKIQDIKIDFNLLNIGRVHHKHLNNMTFARLFAPKLANVDRLLYLDSDMVVNHNINLLLNLNLKDYPFAATQDIAFFNSTEEKDYYFNAGMLLINAVKWRKERYTEKILDYSKAVKDTLDNADETLLNNFFKNNYLQVPLKYNFQIGLEKEIFYNSRLDHQKLINDVKNPIVYHFMSPDKPWKLTSSVSKRDLWWKYYSLDWDKLDKPVEFPKFDKKVFIFTSLAELRDIEVLVKRFPNIEFSIAAYVDMIFMLKRLLQYDNVKLYPMIVGKNIDKLIKESNAMLDITDGPDNEITKRFAETAKPIIGFRGDKFHGVIPEDSDYELVHSTDEIIEKLHELEEK